jgi:hypothetical protein
LGDSAREKKKMKEIQNDGFFFADLAEFSFAFDLRMG